MPPVIPPKEKPDEQKPANPAPPQAGGNSADEPDDDDKAVDALTVEEARARLKLANRERHKLEKKLSDAGLTKAETRNFADELAKLRDEIVDLKKVAAGDTTPKTETAASASTAAVSDDDDEDPLFW